jgi:hypothetical protein
LAFGEGLGQFLRAHLIQFLSEDQSAGEEMLLVAEVLCGIPQNVEQLQLVLAFEGQHSEVEVCHDIE